MRTCHSFKIGVSAAWCFWVVTSVALSQAPVLKLPMALINKKEICITTVYEGSPRIPKGILFPNLEKPRLQKRLDNTPANHVTLFLFESDGSWDFLHLSMAEFGSPNNDVKFDSEFAFLRVPPGFQYCSQLPHKGISCASLTKNGNNLFCAPLFENK